MKNYKTYSIPKSIRVSILICIIFLLPACSKKNYPQVLDNNQDTLLPPDYKNLYDWAAHPWKKNRGDSIPKPLKKNYKKDSLADVFFIHPTTLTDRKDTRWNAPINDSIINNKTDNTSILYQASVFNASCRIFAPRYRQAHIKAFYEDEKIAAPYFDTAYEDIKNAFIYYLQHYNNGRPIIIAAHSQGTKHAARLLKEFFQGKPLENQLVCAYLIGMPIPEDYFSTIPTCKDSTSTGCIISWRTFKKGYTEPKFVAKENFKAIVVNPLNWTTDTLQIPASKNYGGVLLKFNKVIKHVVNGRIHNNVLWTSKPKFFGNIFFTKKNYHAGDINLFYMNIRQNVKTRINAFINHTGH